MGAFFAKSEESSSSSTPPFNITNEEEELPEIPREETESKPVSVEYESLEEEEEKSEEQKTEENKDEASKLSSDSKTSNNSSHPKPIKLIRPKPIKIIQKQKNNFVGTLFGENKDIYDEINKFENMPTKPKNICDKISRKVSQFNDKLKKLYAYDDPEGMKNRLIKIENKTNKKVFYFFIQVFNEDPTKNILKNVNKTDIYCLQTSSIYNLLRNNRIYIPKYISDPYSFINTFRLLLLHLSDEEMHDLCNNAIEEQKNNKTDEQLDPSSSAFNQPQKQPTVQKKNKIYKQLECFQLSGSADPSNHAVSQQPKRPAVQRKIHDIEEKLIRSAAYRRKINYIEERLIWSEYNKPLVPVKRSIHNIEKKPAKKNNNFRDAKYFDKIWEQHRENMQKPPVVQTRQEMFKKFIENRREHIKQVENKLIDLNYNIDCYNIKKNYIKNNCYNPGFRKKVSNYQFRDCENHMRF